MGWLAGSWLLVAGWAGCRMRSPSWRWIELGLVAQVLSCPVLSCRNGLGKIAGEQTNPGRPNRTKSSYSVCIEKSNNGHARLSEYRAVVSYRTIKRDEGAGRIGQTVEAQAKALGVDMGSQVKQNKVDYSGKSL